MSQVIPSRSVFEVMASVSVDELEKDKLLELSSPEGTQELYDYCNRPRRTVLEVLADFPHSRQRLKLDHMFDLMKIIRPRAFSIASSPLVRHFFNHDAIFECSPFGNRVTSAFSRSLSLTSNVRARRSSWLFHSLDHCCQFIRILELKIGPQGLLVFQGCWIQIWGQKLAYSDTGIFLIAMDSTCVLNYAFSFVLSIFRKNHWCCWWLWCNIGLVWKLRDWAYVQIGWRTFLSDFSWELALKKVPSGFLTIIPIILK